MRGAPIASDTVLDSTQESVLQNGVMQASRQFWSITESWRATLSSPRFTIHLAVPWTSNSIISDIVPFPLCPRLRQKSLWRGLSRSLIEIFLSRPAPCSASMPVPALSVDSCSPPPSHSASPADALNPRSRSHQHSTHSRPRTLLYQSFTCMLQLQLGLKLHVL